MKTRNSTKIVFSAPKFFVEESVLTTGKKQRKRYLIVLNDTVTIIPFTQKNELILVKEYRDSVAKNVLMLPGGGIEKGEKPKGAAYRELLEETGYKAGKLTLFSRLHPISKSIRRTQYYYVATNLTKSEQALEGDEKIEVLKISRGKALELVKAYGLGVSEHNMELFRFLTHS